MEVVLFKTTKIYNYTWKSDIDFEVYFHIDILES